MCFKSVPRVFQECFKEVLRVFQGSFKDVSRKFQVCFKKFSRIFQRRLQGALKGCFIIDSKNFKGYFMEISITL